MDNKEAALLMRKNYSKKGEDYQCGKGSVVKNTTEIRLFLLQLINKYKIKSIDDAPCGSFNWMRKVDLSDIIYIGFDIDYGLILKNRINYLDVKFELFDIVTQVLPKADLIICRDCLFHLPTNFIINALNNFKDSGSTYLLATSHLEIKVNVELLHKNYGKEYGFRKINLSIDPFNLGEPLEFIDEVKFNRIVALWRLN